MHTYNTYIYYKYKFIVYLFLFKENIDSYLLSFLKHVLANIAPNERWLTTTKNYY